MDMAFLYIFWVGVGILKVGLGIFGWLWVSVVIFKVGVGGCGVF